MPTIHVSLDDNECRLCFDATGMNEESIKRSVCTAVNEIQGVRSVGDHFECVTLEVPEVTLDDATMEVVAVAKMQRVVVDRRYVPGMPPTVTIKGRSSDKAEQLRSCVEEALRRTMNG